MNEIDDIFKILAKTISQITDIDINDIKLESNVVTDLAVDSLDFLDIIFALDKEYGIKLPVSEWMQEVNQEHSKGEDYFTIYNICKEIKILIDKKQGS